MDESLLPPVGADRADTTALGVAWSAHFAWNRRQLDALMDLWAHDGELAGLDGSPEPGPWIGRAAIRARYESLRAPWRRDVVDAREFLVTGDLVLVPLRWRAWDAGGGLVHSHEQTHLWALRGGLFVRQQPFRDHDAALGAMVAAGADERLVGELETCRREYADALGFQVGMPSLRSLRPGAVCVSGLADGHPGVWIFRLDERTVLGFEAVAEVQR